MARGKFVTLEGGEGGGKSTQAEKLAAALAERDVESILTREPGGSPGAEEIRRLLVTGDPERWQPFSEVLLHYAARFEHVHNTVLPALDSGQWVISDRFADSTLAYQGYGHDMDLDDIAAIHRMALGEFGPDLTVILDLPHETGLARAGSRADAEDRYERMEEAFHDRLRSGFLSIAEMYPERCCVVDATVGIEAVHRAILDAVETRLLAGNR